MDRAHVNLRNDRESPSRLRSRLPNKSPSHNSQGNIGSNVSSIRERSLERRSEKMQKSSLYKKENTSLHDLPLLNTSFGNKIKLPEFREEQDSRGRARLKDRDDVVGDVVDADPNDMISLMGFSGFGTTKGKHVAATKGGAAKKDKKTEYRQYMNRSKGFNRPLSPGR